MKRRVLALWVWAFALAALAYAPALVEWDKSGYGDWQWFHHSWEVGRVALERHHEFPLWDPNHCGGVSMWGQPQAQHVAPTWWITGLLFGTTHGHKLFIILHHAIGFAGLFFVARRLFGFSKPAAALSALAWTFSGYAAWRGAGGHSTFLAFHYLPLIFYAWRRTNDDLRWAGAVAGLMGLTLMEGGTYPFPLIFLFLLFDFVIQVLPPRPSWRVIRTGVITGLLTLAIGAIRLWPVYVTMSRFPRDTTMEDSVTVEHVLFSLTAREPQPWHWGGHRWVWPEYSSFIGWGVLALAGYGALLALAGRGRRAAWAVGTASAAALTWWLGEIALELGSYNPSWVSRSAAPGLELAALLLAAAAALIALGGKGRHRSWVAGAALFLACGMGNVGELWPWPLLHELPVFGNFHVPSRFFVLGTFFLALLAGLALDHVLRRAISSTTHRGLMASLIALAWLLVVASGAEIMSNSIRIAAKWSAPDVFGEVEEHHHLVPPRAYRGNYMHYPHRNVGTAACYDPVPWEVSRGLWVGDRPQIRVQPTDAGEVGEESRTNHTIRGEVTLSAPARVVFNQNFDPDWHFSEGEALSENGLLAVDLPAGAHTIEASFQPADLPWSPLVTLFGLLAALLLAIFGSPERWAKPRGKRLMPRREATKSATGEQDRRVSPPDGGPGDRQAGP